MSQCHDIYDPNEGRSASPEAEAAATPRVDRPTAVAGQPAGFRPGHDCQLLSSRHGDIRVIRVDGPLDWATEAKFEDLMCDECLGDPVVIVNLTASRLDAAGTGGLLVAAERAAERGQQLVIVVTDPRQLAVLVATGLNIVVPIVASEYAALEWCERHAVPADTKPTVAPGSDRSELAQS
jgi:anti-anti-sigma factor